MIRATISMKGDRLRLVTISATAAGMLRKAAALPRIEAPSTISAIIEQVWTAPMAMARSAGHLSSPCRRATIRAPNTPTPAASEGVARPPYIEPSTHRIRNTAGPSSLIEARYSAIDAIRTLRSASGTSDGLIAVWIMIQAMKQPASRKPGMKPAVNSLAIETSPSTP